MKKIFLTTVGFLFFCLGIILFINLSEPNIEASGDSNVEPTAQETNTEESTKYFVKEFKGKIAIFKENENTFDNKDAREIPYKTLDIAVKDLPIDDQNLLKTGICVETEDELHQIIEDYSS